MSTDPTPSLSTHEPASPLVVELTLEEQPYRIVLPHAATDYIQKRLATERAPYEHEMLEDIRARVAPGALVLDVGANIGNHTLYLAAVARCRVEAFEPNPELCAALRESIALNGFGDSVHLHETGLGRRAGTARFGVSTPENLGGQHLTLGEGELRVNALDSFAFGHPVDVIKLDVEGMEIDVLEGARALLQRDRPLIYVECSTEAHYRHMSRWMSAQRYTYWDTFNATPTHLFIPAERLSFEQRLQHLQAKTAQNDYKSNQLLREVRLRISQAQEREREARAALVAAQAREIEERARVNALSTRLQVSEQQLAGERHKSDQLVREVGLRLSEAQEREADARAALAGAQARESEERARVSALSTRLQVSEQHFASDRRRLAEQVAGLQTSLSAEQTASASLRTELAQGKFALEKLKRIVEVREVRLAATERREAVLAERMQRTRESAAFQIGQALTAAGRSMGGMMRLPLRLLRIYRDARARRRVRAAEGHEALPVDRQPSGTQVRRAHRHDTAPGPAAQTRMPTSAALPVDRQPRGAQVRGAPMHNIATGRAAQARMPAAARDPARLPRIPATLLGLRVAGIMDEFTHHSFGPECELLPLRLAGWHEHVEAFQPDVVFVESAWRGAEGDWTLKISNPSEELAGLVGWAQSRGVPTVFWNKEDPVHFSTFLHVARAVDYVFTTDIDCVARYKREVGHDRVYLLPFAAQPATHNPIERFPRDDAFCFAGSYYLKYPERQRDFRSLLDVVKDLKPVEIFDRNFAKAHPHYEFPPEYQPYIVGSLPFDQIDKAYKGYRYGINMNTIKQSQTMFARRVFELLASNTVVVSNFSRGMRLMFGDLVISSDASSEIRRRLAPLADDTTLRKFRLAGLRKVMGQHTYAHRLAYIAEKLGGMGLAALPARLCAVAFPKDADEARALVRSWRRQSLSDVRLCLVGGQVPADLLDEQIQHAADATLLGSLHAYAEADWIAPLSAADYHGPNYLLDLHQAIGYCEAQAIGKAAHFLVRAGAPDTVELIDAEHAYRNVERLPVRASVLERARFESLGIVDAPALDGAMLEGDGLVAIDEFNYAMQAGPQPSAAACAAVDDLPDLRVGLDTARELLPRAERIAAATQPDAAASAASVPGLSAEQLLALVPGSAKARLANGELALDVALPDGKHRYVYLDRVFTRAELNLEMNSRFQLLCSKGESLEVSTVFEFLDEQQQKIGHAINKAGDAYSLAMPARCRLVHFGLRFVGKGTLRIQRLVLADLRERPTVFVGTARHLVVVKQYPDYEDLYKYGFVHSRLRAYARERLACDVFRLASEEPYACREFESVDVVTGDRDLLDLALRSGAYHHVLIHLMDRTIWEVVTPHLDRMKVTVWVHGAEIQVWQRRQFEFERMDEAEIERQKKLSDQRLALWQEVLREPHPNLRLVFVSRRFGQEAMADLGLDLAAVPHEIIHNYIDPNVFPYVKKSAADRLRLLSIRPFVSRAYANDLTVKALLSIAGEPWFKDLRVTIVGDGPLFEEVTNPLVGMPNVTLIRRFLTQPEIAQMHREHGVFLTPSRMDTQGVSRDEAMSSGLVPITTRVAAIPEFVDEGCALLAPEEDHEGLAAAIRRLHDDAALFLRLSEAAAQRVRAQSGFEHTIRRELDLLHD